ncbi:hypothetical protein [Helicobacter labetoulli]|uniref:hypothetical protein n=1 Tax=Helicobacter labetoulli TaxID=2315333 RepID=UPI000EF7276B|nr:hypothetical protein [Helicobacter labetoulli]
MICVFSPYAVYSSDVSQFDISQTYQTLGALFGFFILSSFGFIYLTSFFYKTRLLKLGAYGVSVLALVCFSYTFIFTGNIFTGLPYAQLDGLLFRDGGAGISHIYAKYFDMLYILFLCILCFVLFIRKIGLFALFVLLFLLAIFVISTLVSVGDIVSQVHKIASTQTDIAKQDKIIQMRSSEDVFKAPKYIAPYLSFSKKKNILVLFSDMVQADNFTQALKDQPELFDIFDGFTYYENSLSASNITFGSSPSISGGAHYHPIAINERKLKYNLSEETANAVAGVANTFARENYEVTIGTVHLTDEELLAKKLSKQVFLIPSEAYKSWNTFYRDIYKIQNIGLEESLPIGELFSIGLFRATPYILRTRIYQGGGWFFSHSLLNNHYESAISNVSTLATFAELSNLDAKKQTFKYLLEASEHFPYLLDIKNNCMPINSHSEYRLKVLNDQDGLAYSNHLCYIRKLTQWLDWFKKQGIYDNTKIIIISDHGNGGVGAPLIDFPRKELRNSHVLILVKEFNARGKLKINRDIFVSNSDAMAFACDEIGSVCPHIGPSVLKKPIKNRELIFSFVDGGTGRMLSNMYDILLSYKVRNSIFDLSNWQDITEEVKNGTFK